MERVKGIEPSSRSHILSIFRLVLNDADLQFASAFAGFACIRILALA